MDESSSREDDKRALAEANEAAATNAAGGIRSARATLLQLRLVCRHALEAELARLDRYIEEL